MKTDMTILTLVLLVVGLAAPTRADWKPGDPYKMHYPQLPDPTGWDVNATTVTLADDFLCTATGPITDIHFWGSWRGDQIGQIRNAHLSIHANVPADGTGFSQPGQVLWQWDVEPTLIGTEPISPQGWYDPSTGVWNKPDHTLWYQYNIVNIPNPFMQEQGIIYWLDSQVTAVDARWGWKTSVSPHFMDDAVWAHLPAAAPAWQPIVDPITGESLDLAFVITPEPVSIALLSLGVPALIRRRH